MPLANPPLIAITGGGTGGHVYPGLAVAAALGEMANVPGGGQAARVLYVGSNGGMEREIVGRAGLPFADVASGAVLGKGPLGQAGSAVRLLHGILQSLGIIHRHRVAGILATGGYVSAPVVLAGALLGVPSLIYLPDVEPGLAVQFLSRFARRVAVTGDHSCRFFPAQKVVVTGYPLRGDLLTASRAAAREMLGIEATAKVLLVLGGSRGAHSINAAVAEALPSLLRDATVIHSSGPHDEPWLRGQAESLPIDLRPRYRLWAYLHEELAPSMAAADLAVSRAGASVMGEYPAVGLPSILVPYPYAGAHQERNADFLVQKRAAVKLLDQEVRAGKLVPLVTSLLAGRERLAEMAAAARAMARPEAANAIAQELLSLCLRT